MLEIFPKSTEYFPSKVLVFGVPARGRPVRVLHIFAWLTGARFRHSWLGNQVPARSPQAVNCFWEAGCKNLPRSQVMQHVLWQQGLEDLTGWFSN